MPAPVLSEKRRKLILAADAEWRTVDELMDIANDALSVSSRRADRFSRSFVRRTVDLLIDYSIFDYAAALSPEMRMRRGSDDGLWRLTPAGLLLQSEIRRAH